MAIRVIAVGKLKETYFASAAEEYILRLSKYCKLNVVEVADEKDPGPQSQALVEKAKDLEGDKILGRIEPRDTVVALAIEGTKMGSPELARQVQAWVELPNNLVFVIGGSNGLSDRVLARANFKFSFSDMTFPHQLARVILLEQLYRAFKINAGERYHK